MIPHSETPRTHRTSQRAVLPRVGDALLRRWIAVVNVGYVGPRTAVSFPDEGPEVICLGLSKVGLVAIKDIPIELLPPGAPRPAQAVVDHAKVGRKIVFTPMMCVGSTLDSLIGRLQARCRTPARSQRVHRRQTPHAATANGRAPRTTGTAHQRWTGRSLSNPQAHPPSDGVGDDSSRPTTHFSFQ